jgi:hypothetical protein
MINNSDIDKTTITRNQAIEQLCALGGIYELNSTQINGRNVKVFKNAPRLLQQTALEAS